MAWLVDDSLTKHDHDHAKISLSQEAAFDVRVSGRAKFLQLAELKGGIFQQVLAREAELAGAGQEPTVIR